MEGNQKWPSLGQFVLEHIEIGFNALEASIVYFRGFIVHGYHVFIQFPDFLHFNFVCALKGQFFQEFPQPDGGRTVFGADYLIKCLEFGHVAILIGFLHFLDHHFFSLGITALEFL